MTKRFLFGIDESKDSVEALERFALMYRGTSLDLHLFHAIPESSLLAPGELSTLSGEPSGWEKEQELRAKRVLEQAVSLLVQIGYQRSRVDGEQKIRSVNVAQDILDASEKAGGEPIVLARRRYSVVKRFLMGSTSSMVCQHADKQPVWVIGRSPLQPPHVLVALDQSDQGRRIVAHMTETLTLVPEARFTLFHVMPAKPPGYWDDGHILDEVERSKRREIVDQWRLTYGEEKMAETFAGDREALESAGVESERIVTKMRPMTNGIARDILAETREGGYNILVFGRRGTSLTSEFSLGGHASKILQSAPDCTLILVN